MLRVKSGILGCSIFSISLASYIAIKGPYIEDQYMRFALAGTAATVAVEFGTHGLDTLNMRSKAVSGNKKLLISVYKLEGFASLFRGLQAVVYGYAFCSVIYFYVYAYTRDIFYEKWKRHNQAKIGAIYEEKCLKRQNEESPVERIAPVTSAPLNEGDVTFGQQLISCFAASFIAETLALPIYYPYDLMKTRMQTTEVRSEYNNLFDAFVKTYQEELPTSIEESKGLMRCTFLRLKRFYSAMSLYGGTFVTFIALEFSLYETLLRQIEAKCEGKSVLSHSIEQMNSLRVIQSTIVQIFQRLISILNS